MQQKLTAGTRIGSMLLDHVFMTMILMVFFLPDFIAGFAKAFKVGHEPMEAANFFRFKYIGLVGFALYFCKDCINGRSIAKRLLRLQVVDSTTGKVASPLRCLVRNLFCVLWPVEVIVTLFNPGRRIGDQVAGTRVVWFDPAAEQSKSKFFPIAISLVLAYGIMILLLLSFNSVLTGPGTQKIAYVSSSYNEQESKATEQVFLDSLGSILRPDVRVYDRIQNEGLKYVSVIL